MKYVIGKYVAYGLDVRETQVQRRDKREKKEGSNNKIVEDVGFQHLMGLAGGSADEDEAMEDEVSFYS